MINKIINNNNNNEFNPQIFKLLTKFSLLLFFISFRLNNFLFSSKNMSKNLLRPAHNHMNQYAYICIEKNYAHIFINLFIFLYIYICVREKERKREKKIKIKRI